MKTIINGFLVIIFFASNSVQGQFVNKGDMAILQETLVSTKFNFNNSANGTLKNDGNLVVFSDFNNDGLLTFSSDKQGTTNFQGTRRQIISGMSPSEFSKFNNVIFDNNSVQPAFLLSGDISVSGTSDFLNGNVKINELSGAMVYEINASHANTNNESHVDGYVEKKGNTEFEYPIGNDSYFRPAKIIPVAINNEKTEVYVGKYFLENSDLLYPHSSRVGNLQSINNQEYWTINNYSNQEEKKSDQGAVIVSLSWDESTTPGFLWQDLDVSQINEEMITIVRWDKDQKLWVDEGGVVEIGPNGISSGTVTSFSKTSGDGIFTLGKVKKRVEPLGNVVAYNAVSPNGDGKNDYFTIAGIQNYPNNEIMIFNRWGVKVFETTNYDSNGNVFRGISEGRSTMSSESKLPTGTYFYILKYEMKEGNSSKNVEKAGYLYLIDN